MEEERFNKLLKKIHNPRAFNILYNFYYSKIVSHIYFKFKSKDLGEDVAQEFFVKLLQIKTDYVTRPTAWVYVVCDNIAKDYLLADKKYNMAYTDDEPQTGDVAFEYLLFGEYKEKMDSLDEITRDIIILKEYEGYRLKELSADMGINYNTVRQKYSRGIKKLQDICKTRNNFD